MPKKLKLNIVESTDFLEKEFLKATSTLEKDRIKSLLFVKKSKYNFASEIGLKLGRTEKTIRNWFKSYLIGGFSELIEVKSGGNNTQSISAVVADFIEVKLNDINTTITSYVELQLLIEYELKAKIAYTALYSHCKTKHKSKLKVARKSHHKKDEIAEELFKKP